MASNPPVTVIKLGGAVVEQRARMALLAADLRAAGQAARIVIVHGGGEQVDRFCERLRIPVEKVLGRRVTDPRTLDALQMVVAGKVNTELVAMLNAAGVSAVGLTGLDARLVTAHKRPPVEVQDPATGAKQTVDYGWVGDIDAIQTGVLDTLLAGGHVPVVACLGGGNGAVLNINADTIAVEIARAMRAARLLFLSGVPGVLHRVNDPASLAARLSRAEIQDWLKQGIATGGMIPKLQNALRALDGGVGAVGILDGESAGSKLADALAGRPAGTTISL